MVKRPPHAFVCGYPIAQSRSPLIHGYWLERYGLQGTYKAREVTPEDFPAFLGALREQGYVGGNITIPHKEAAYRLVDLHDEEAAAIAAVNTIWFEEGLLKGGNSDAYGFTANLDQAAPGWDRGKATVLGAGGAALAVVHALQQRGFSEIRIVNRTVQRARNVVDRFQGDTSAHGWNAVPELLSDTDFLVNTTSLGMQGSTGPEISLDAMPDTAIVTDIVYVPLITPLLSKARNRGLKIVDGLGMLLHQAVPGFERWFGVRPEVTQKLRDIVIADLEAEH